jgi:hypothetical protein
LNERDYFMACTAWAGVVQLAVRGCDGPNLARATAHRGKARGGLATA